VALVVLTLVLANLPRGRPWLVDHLGIQPGQDKVGHFWLMGLFAAALMVALRGLTWRGRTIAGPWVLALAAVLVSFDEALQLVVPGRAATWEDLQASLAGIAVLGVGAWLGCVVVERWRGTSSA
jgi:VanZ family protein